MKKEKNIIVTKIQKIELKAKEVEKINNMKIW